MRLFTKHILKNMRTIPFYLFTALLFVFFSCSKEDVTPIDQKLLIGDWNVTAIKYTGTSTTSYSGVSYTAKFTGTGIDMDYMVSFTENPNNFMSSGTYSIELVTEVMGDKTTQVVTMPDLILPGTWSVKGDKLIVEAQGEIQEGTINKLNATQMILTSHLKNTTTQSGMAVSSDIVIVYTFEKD